MPRMKTAVPSVRSRIPAAWRTVLSAELKKPYFAGLEEFLRRERAEHRVFPPEDEVFTALELCPYRSVRVLILGQDPYHDEGQAHGLAFSVRPGTRLPPSLINIFKELHDDVGVPIPRHGCLVSWAQQGVLLLNAVLTVRAHQPNSHRNKGWELFTDAVIQRLNDREQPVVFVFWGGNARKKTGLVDPERHTVIHSAHPSPLSAKSGFFGSRPFSKINRALVRSGIPAIDWRLPDKAG